jgi:hypothetical protein
MRSAEECAYFGKSQCSVSGFETFGIYFFDGQYESKINNKLAFISGVNQII